jgi:flagellar hook protein FlgE
MSMDPLEIALSGLNAYGTQIDVSANNVANVGTAGFAGQDVEFDDVFAGAVIARIGTNPAPGGLDPVGGATNLAISGAGFFALAGPNGTITYTRSGDFITGATGELVDAASGLAVLGTGGQPIVVPPGAANLAIGADGTVRAVLPGGGFTAIGRIALATFQNPGGLIHVSGGYEASVTSGSARFGAPATAGYGALVSGFLETSNVDLGDEFVKMIASQAAFDANAKTVRTGDQLLETAVHLDSDGETA